MPKAKLGCQVAFSCLLYVPVGPLKPPRADAVAPVCRLPVVAGEPGVMGFADTGSFALLSGITCYRIDRRELGQQSGNWVADDFTFVAANPVPEPQTYALMLAGLCVLAWARRRTLGSSFTPATVGPDRP